MQGTFPFTPQASLSPAASHAAPQSAPPAEVAIASLEAADKVLAEIGQLDARERSLSAECDKELKRIREQYSSKMKVQVAGVLLSFVDRRNALLAAVRSFAIGNRAKILEGDLKSKKLNHGTIGWRKSPAKLEPVEGGSTAGCADVLDKLVAHLRCFLEKFTGLAPKIVNAVKITVAHDKTAIKKLLENKEVTAAQVRKAGFELTEGEDVLYVDVNAAEVASVSADPPKSE